MATVVVLGTCDSKFAELQYLRTQIEQVGHVKAILLDVGRTEVNDESIDIPQSQLFARYGDGMKKVDGLARNDYIHHMAVCATNCVRDLQTRDAIHGIIAAGGSCGTALSSAVMRDALPLGFPKLIVSTIASGDTGPIVEETDITLMYSIVDIAGLNDMLRVVLRNASAAISGMAQVYFRSQQSSPLEDVSAPKKTRIGITMFGVTTPCVEVVRDHLETKYQDQVEVYVFHATGHGGRAMERLISTGQLDAVLDLTTTEICDLLTDGNMSAGPHRLEAAAKAGIPNIISLGATDMSNYGPRSTVPERYKDRFFYEHNSMVTLMRTSKDECKQIGDFIAEKLRTHVKSKDLTEIWIPKGGTSLLSVLGGPFADATADEALFEAIRSGLRESGISIVEDERAINDEGFAKDIASRLSKLIGLA